MKREAKERESGERMEERRGNGVAEDETVRSKRLELGLRIRLLRDLKTAMDGEHCSGLPRLKTQN